ncbi:MULTISPECIES: hypothetical protein [Asticcacaulis]|uniref:hypothetical protein n=1 Tax=Asticcacaulis TaxID=76890 RepID=UPI001AE6F4D9|nr:MULTISPECIES: hypothetical protein [Asticcacaulis]MBP2160358.1 hypothetical protein [Asticcacaulis solisilvae]MDR6801339.1 hypothetical protein [Asticcacaulis sp. BE141]
MWSDLYIARSEGIFQKWDDIDTACLLFDKGVELEALHAQKRLQRVLVRVAEKEPKSTKIRSDLSMLASDRPFLQGRFHDFEYRLGNFTASLHETVRPIFYGNVKEIPSLQKSIIDNRKPMPTAAHRINTDYRDLVRFRFVASDISSLIRLCWELWDNFFDEIVLCKNYYLNPISIPSVRPYNGIHFIIVDADGFPAEVQIITAVREAIGILDHRIVYKADPRQVPHDFVNYISLGSMAAIIVDQVVSRKS